MSYAVRKDGKGWRAVNGINDVNADEDFRETMPENTPDQIKAEIWERIKEKRDFLTKNGGYKVGNKWYHSDEFSRTQQLGLVLLGANIPAGTKWKTMDGSFVNMTQTLAGQILSAAAASDLAFFQAAELHKAAMEASTDPENYDFSSGWPDTYLKQSAP